MRWWSPLVVVMLVVAGCTNDQTEPASSTTTSTVAGSTTSTTAQITDACVSGDLAFGEEGLVAAIGEVESDATMLSQIRWEQGTACERLVISFATDSGAPATTVGLTGVSIIAFAGVIRVDLPEDVTSTAVADAVTDGLVSRTYVVRDGTDLGIDIHGAPDTAIAARAFLTSSPASLVIDVILADGLPDPVGASISETAVVITPPPGPTLYPFAVEGYAVPGADSVHLLISNNSVDVVNLAIALDGATDAWQAVSTRIDDGPAGQSVLFMGEVDANDAPLLGVEVPLDLP
ncbi:MAG: hypothetical protein ACR2NG_06060 [Acidimicrobiia bacterium]